MNVNTYSEVEELAKQSVLYAMKNEDSKDCLFETQHYNSILYKIYDDLYRRNNVVGSFFALHLYNVYQIKLQGLSY